MDFFQSWDFNNPLKTKELYLTHRLISEGAGFAPLFEVYNQDPILKIIKYSKYSGVSLEECINQKNPNLKTERHDIWEVATKYSLEQLKRIYISTDQLVEGGAMKKDGRGDTKDRLQKHLDKIQACFDYFIDGDIKQFVELTDYQIRSIKDKKILRQVMDQFSELVSKKQSIGEVIDWADKNGVIVIDDKLQQFIDDKGYVYERVRSIPYEVFQNLYRYNQKVSPYSTQHGVKGAEYEDVLIVLDNGGWNNYNFKYLFTDNGTDTVLSKTKKIFYVGCSRAMNNLAVYYFNPDRQIIDKAKEWFGGQNVINADQA